MIEKKIKLSRASCQPVTDNELLEDLKKVSSEINSIKVTQGIYEKLGTYNVTTVGRRFGTWNKALEKANLSLSNEVKISDERLYENLLNLWQNLGRQPRRSDLTNKISQFSQTPYKRRFGSWMSALENFINYANESDIESIAGNSLETPVRSTGRDPSFRLRYKIFKRDNFSCCICGAGPAKDLSVELHIDHVTPWSKGGLTTLENLRTLCSKCNLGKSNLE